MFLSSLHYIFQLYKDTFFYLRFAKNIKHCFPKTPEIPAAIPPIIPVTKIKRETFPFKGNNIATFLAKIKSLALPSQKEYAAQKIATAKKGTKNIAVRFKRMHMLVIKAAIITDHHGKN